MKALEDLEAAYAAATQGEWERDEDFVHTSDTFVAECAPYGSNKYSEQFVANAHLICEMKNHLPALIECVKALERVLREAEHLAKGTTWPFAHRALAKLEEAK